MQEGNAALARRDYAGGRGVRARGAEQGSRTSPRADDAQFLLAQALAGQRNYRAQAAIAYDDAYNRSPHRLSRAGRAARAWPMR